MSKVSVIIPNYNGEAFLKDCLDSLKQQTMKDFELIVVDNASRDNGLSIVEKDYPEAVIIRMTENHGFSRAVNEGIRAASAEYVLALNNDTVVEPDFILRLYEAINKDKRVFSVQAKMLQLYHKELIDSAGDLYCALGWAFSRGKDKPADSYCKREEIFSACAGAAIYRKSVFEEIGFFDEKHFSYLEDVDLGYRARINGYKNIYAPDAIVYHVGSGVSGSRYNSFKIRLAARNSIYVIHKNMPLLQLLLNLPFVLVGILIKMAFFIKKGEGKAYFSGIREGIVLAFTTGKYSFSGKNIGNYVKIQLELWINMIKRVTGEL